MFTYPAFRKFANKFFLLGLVAIVGVSAYVYITGPTKYTPLEEINSQSEIHVQYINESAEKYEIKVSYPEFTGSIAAGEASAVLESQIKAQVQEFKKEALTLDGQSELEISVEDDYALQTHVITPEYISVLMVYYQNMASSAHPMHGTQVFNYDLRKHKLITIADLFKKDTSYIKILEDKIAPDLKKQFAERGMPEEPFDNSVWQGTADTFSHFIITPEGLDFFFDPYMVAAYAAGDFEAFVPYSDLAEVLSPEFKPYLGSARPDQAEQ